MKYFLISLLFITTSSLYLYSCATRAVPTGGPKDTIPPRLINTIPINKSLNFNGNTIVLNFDEFIKIKDLNNQLIITPRLKEDIEHKINKRSLIINLNEKLDSNTTYTFNFQDGVQDITESNPARDLILAFSTGDYIDSLFIEGNVKDLLTDKTIENAVVALYPYNDTSNVFNHKPQYFTRTKKEGYFRLENLKNNVYKIYAYSDANKNLTLQSDTEPYGFIADSIVLDTSITDITIPLVKRNVKEFILQSARSSGKYYEIRLSKYIEDYTLTPIQETEDSLISNKATDPSIIRVYNTISSDSVLTIVNAIDTVGQQVLDTVAIKFAPTQRKSDPATAKISPASSTTILEEYEGILEFNKPIKAVHLDSIFFYYDSLMIVPVEAHEIEWNKFKDKLTIKTKLDKALLEREIPQADTLTTDTTNLNIEEIVQEEEENTTSQSRRNKKEEGKKIVSKFEKRNNQIMLFMAKGSFITIENDTLAEIKTLHSFQKMEDLGLIKGTISTEYTSYIIQLLDKTRKVAREIKNESNFIFRNLTPGEYHIRILIDNNEDGEWSLGNILENIPPEEVYFYPEPLIIRANWERELDPITL